MTYGTSINDDLGAGGLENVVVAVKDANGNTVAVNSGANGLPRPIDNRLPETSRLLDGGSPLLQWGGTIRAADWAISAGAPTVTTITRNGRQCLKIVTAVTTTASIDLTLPDTCWHGRAHTLLEGGRNTNLEYLGLLVTGDNFTNYAQRTKLLLNAPASHPEEQGGIFTHPIDGQAIAGASDGCNFEGQGASWGTTVPALDGTVTVNKIRINFSPLAGTSATIYLYGISLAPKRRKGRIFVTFDDGYKSQISLGLPIFQARGIPTTHSMITGMVGATSDYMNWEDCRQVIAAGGQIVAHGPTNNPTDNLFNLYTNTADRLADMVAARQAIADNGCATPGFDRVYVWPQGSFQTAFGDFALLDAAMAAGFTVGRSASPIRDRFENFSACSKYQKMALPIIGHTFTTAGAEAANIAAITTAISAAAALRADVVLMLHRVVKTADTPTDIGIRVSDLITIADAIQTEITNGTMQAGVLGNIYDNSCFAD